MLLSILGGFDDNDAENMLRCPRNGCCESGGGRQYIFEEQGDMMMSSITAINNLDLHSIVPSDIVFCQYRSCCRYTMHYADSITF